MKLLPSEPGIVVIGGGTGCSAILSGLRAYTSRLTAVVTVIDNGGSSGRLRKDLGLPALGDMRRCMIALASRQGPPAELATLFEHRFQSGGPLQDHSLGNLLLAAIIQRAAMLDEGIEEVQQLLGVTGAVLPVTLDTSNLVTTLADGTVLEGEEALDRRGPSSVAVERIALTPPVQANPKAVRALHEADAIVVGPGDLYTSVLVNLLVEGIPQAIRRSKGKLLFVGNLATKPGETDGYKLSDFLREALRYLDTGEVLDAVLVDSGVAVAELLPAGAKPVVTDVVACQGLTNQIITGAVAREDAPWLHHSERTAAAIIELLASLG